MKPAVVILAAGRGTRMRSPLPKALVPVCGKPMLWHLLEAVKPLRPSRVVVVAGYRHADVKRWVDGRAVVVEQKQLLGSGHAVAQAEGALKGHSGDVFVLYCDTPLVRTRTLKALWARHRQTRSAATLLSLRLDDPTGYGRVARKPDGSVASIIEELDCGPVERMIRDVNAGCYVFDKKRLFAALARVRRNPKKNEFYLTDAVGILAASTRVEAAAAADPGELVGINTRLELAAAQEALRRRILEDWIDRGVEIRHPASTFVESGVRLGAGTVVEPHTVIEQDAVIGSGCVIGPFARIRGGSRVDDGAVIGNFVELVRTRVGRGSQVKHLTYLGDAVLGRNVNVGAGTITANYDGVRKARTTIRDGAFIGSGTVLVAPVTVGRRARTGAGAVVTRGHSVPDGATVVGIPARIHASRRNG